jgi:hypothetical protein
VIKKQTKSQAGGYLVIGSENSWAVTMVLACAWPGPGRSWNLPGLRTLVCQRDSPRHRPSNAREGDEKPNCGEAGSGAGLKL